MRAASRLTRILVSLGLVFLVGQVSAWGHERDVNCRPTPDGIPSSEYPFENKYVTIDGFRIHYVEEGEGDPILFIHGNPTWSYIWRNVFPCVAHLTHRRAIALDLLGLGMSDKPKLDYTAALHEHFVTEFIRRLHLRNLIIVGQDWGGPMMSHFAVDHPGRIQGLVLLETFAWKLAYSDFGFFAPFIQFARSAEGQQTMINNKTWFVENFIELGVINKSHFTDEVFAHYLNALPTPQSRTAMAKFPRLVPIVDDPATPQASLDFFTHIENNLHRLRDKAILIIKADPGNLISADSQNKVDAFIAQLPQTDVRDMGPGIHPVQEDNPGAIVNVLSKWLWEKGLAGFRFDHDSARADDDDAD